MKLNNIIADLNFIKSHIHKFEANCNMSEIEMNNKKSFGMDIKCSNPVIKGNKKIGKLLLQIDITVEHVDENGTEDTIGLLIEGVFSTDSSVDDESFLELLNINGGAALYSIARAKIEAFSSMIYNEGKLLLPMINIVQYFNERSESEE